MNSQMETQDAVPIFHCAAGSHTILPSTEQLGGYGVPIPALAAQCLDQGSFCVAMPKQADTEPLLPTLDRPAAGSGRGPGQTADKLTHFLVN
jgi:hypothetical protein